MFDLIALHGIISGNSRHSSLPSFLICSDECSGCCVLILHWLILSKLSPRAFYSGQLSGLYFVQRTKGKHKEGISSLQVARTMLFHPRLYEYPLSPLTMPGVEFVSNVLHGFFAPFWHRPLHCKYPRGTGTSLPLMFALLVAIMVFHGFSPLKISDLKIFFQFLYRLSFIASERVFRIEILQFLMSLPGRGD